MVVGTLVVGIAGLWVAWDEPDARVRSVVVGGMVLGFLLLMTALMGLSYLLQPFSARRLFRQQRTLDREFIVSWDDAGVSYVTDSANSHTPWHEYYGWYDGADVLLLMLNDRLFQFLPHRVLTAEQLMDLRTLGPRAGEARQ